MEKSRRSHRLTTAIGLSALALSLLAPASPSWADDPETSQTTAPLVQQFEDVPDNNTFAAFINSLYVSGIISGYACGGPGEPCGPGNLPYYRPGAAVTRGQMSKFVDNVRHLPNIEIVNTSYPLPIVASTTNINGLGMVGVHAATDGVTAGVQGSTNSTAAFGTGVQGVVNSTAPGGNSAGVRGVNNGTGASGVGVYGSQAGSGYGVFGTSPLGRGVYGVHTATSGTEAGVVGQTNSTTPQASGVFGVVSSTSPGNYSAAVRGTNNSTTGAGSGVSGSHAGTGYGVYGTSLNGTGVYGEHASTIGLKPGVYGTTASTQQGASAILGEALSNTASNVTAVMGVNQNLTNNGTGVGGVSMGNGVGVSGVSMGSGLGVSGYSASGIAIFGESDGLGVKGVTHGSTVDDIAVVGLAGPGASLAAKFYGDVEVTGTCCAAAMGTFRIDDPQDPANQYLTHAAVASDELLDIYNGIVTLDASGSATVQMPAWFSSINSTFRYQLTAIGDAAPNLHIASKMQGNMFKIGGGAPNIEVSWQVTGVRMDPYANANRPVVETAKPANEKGTYLHPELYNQPASKATYPMPESTFGK